MASLVSMDTMTKERKSRLRSRVEHVEEITPFGEVVEPGFVEPQLANSNIVTGQRLEDPPTVKIKKELGVFTKKATSNKFQKIAADNQNISLEELSRYEKSLKNQREIEDSTTFSNIRSNLKRNSAETDNYFSDSEKSKRGIKRIRRGKAKGNKKDEHPRSELKASLSVANEKLIALGNDVIDEPTTSEVDSTALNNDYCSCCGMTGLFLCCESCPKSYHFQCINPPVDPNNLPEVWYCKECIKKKVKHKGGKDRERNETGDNNEYDNLMLNVGIYAKLFDNIIFQDPISFQLPKEIIESFQGISIDKLGDYNDETFKPTKTYKQLVKEYDDPLNGVYDKDNNPLFCYKCGESGLKKEHQLINCDYCSLSWHLDCLDPPLTSIKKLGSKWKCPNHVDDLISKPIRKFKDQTVVPVSNIENFEKFGKLPINANIKIVNIEDRLSLLKKEIKSLHDNNNANLRFSNLTFELNEEDVILNFINNNKIKKINEDQQNLQNLMNLKPNLKDYVMSLSKLSNKSIIHNEFKLINLQKLLKISDEELKIEQGQEFTKDEIKEFFIIKRLIEKKGKDKLLEFLKS